MKMYKYSSFLQNYKEKFILFFFLADILPWAKGYFLFVPFYEQKMTGGPKHEYTFLSYSKM